MLLGALLLFAAPAMPSAAAISKGDCCAETPCHHDGKKAACPDACVLACLVIVAPESLVVGSAEVGAAPARPMIGLQRLGRALAPELPPPR